MDGAYDLVSRGRPGSVTGLEGQGSEDLVPPHWKNGAFSPGGQGASDRFEHGGDMVRFFFVCSEAPWQPWWGMNSEGDKTGVQGA